MGGFYKVFRRMVSVWQYRCQIATQTASSAALAQVRGRSSTICGLEQGSSPIPLSFSAEPAPKNSSKLLCHWPVARLSLCGAVRGFVSKARAWMAKFWASWEVWLASSSCSSTPCPGQVFSGTAVEARDEAEFRAARAMVLQAQFEHCS